MMESLTVWSERPEFGVYHSLDGLAKQTAIVLIAALVDRLGYSMAEIPEPELRSIVDVCTQFSLRVYGSVAVPRAEALGAIPHDSIGEAFRAVERLVQPNGFS